MKAKPPTRRVIILIDAEVSARDSDVNWSFDQTILEGLVQKYLEAGRFDYRFKVERALVALTKKEDER